MRNTIAYVSSFSPDPSKAADFGLHVLQLDPETGLLTVIQQLPSVNASWLALDTNQRFLYLCYSLRDAQGRPVGSIEAYQIEPHTGKLTLLNQLALSSGPAHLAVAPDGKQLVVANYYYGDFVLVSLNENGSLGAISSSFQNNGKGPYPRQEAPHPHAVVFDSSGRFCVTADLGLDKLQSFRLTAAGLELISEVSVSAGTGPRHITFSADGKNLYVIGELSGTLTNFTYDAATGKIGEERQSLVTCPRDYLGAQSGAEIKVHPTGKFLYASNRGSRSIAAYRIKPSDGSLVPIGSVSQEIENPTCFAVDPSGTWLYVPNNGGKDIVSFHIDPESGKLAPTGQKTLLPAPNVIVFRKTNESFSKI